MSAVVVTGASGGIGRACVPLLRGAPHEHGALHAPVAPVRDRTAS